MSSEVSSASSQQGNSQLSSLGPALIITVAIGEVKAEFSGSAETVLQSVNAFVAKQVPEIALARKVALNFSAKELIEKFENFVRITPEGPRVWRAAEMKHSDKELVALQLVAQRIASDTLGGCEPSMALTALQDTTALNPKSLSSRLSELSKAGYVTRESAPDGTKFRITTQGIDWLANSLNK